MKLKASSSFFPFGKFGMDFWAVCGIKPFVNFLRNYSNFRTACNCSNHLRSGKVPYASATSTFDLSSHFSPLKAMKMPFMYIYTVYHAQVSTMHIVNFLSVSKSLKVFTKIEK